MRRPNDIDDRQNVIPVELLNGGLRDAPPCRHELGCLLTARETVRYVEHEHDRQVVRAVVVGEVERVRTRRLGGGHAGEHGSPLHVHVHDGRIGARAPHVEARERRRLVRGRRDGREAHSVGTGPDGRPGCWILVTRGTGNKQRHQQSGATGCCSQRHPTARHRATRVTPCAIISTTAATNKR